jgi:hypothetical protein
LRGPSAGGRRIDRAEKSLPTPFCSGKVDLRHRLHAPAWRSSGKDRLELFQPRAVAAARRKSDQLKAQDRPAPQITRWPYCGKQMQIADYSAG